MRSRNSRGKMQGANAGRQRGVAAIFVAIALTALLASMLLIVDIGNLYLAQRGLEQQATMAALAGASALCTSSSDPASAGSSAAAGVVTANHIRKSQAVPTMGGDGFLTGSVQTASGLQVFTPGAPTPGTSSSVQVNLGAESTPGIVTSISDRNQVGLSASAAATQQIFGAFEVGTTLASLHLMPVGTTVKLVLPTIPTKSVGVPGSATASIADVAAFATVMSEQDPSTDQFVAPGASVTASNIQVSVRIHLNVVITGVATVNLPLAIDIMVPGGKAELAGITCPLSPKPGSTAGNPDAGYTANMLASTTVATVTLGTFVGPASTGGAEPVPAPIATPPTTVLTVAVPLLPGVVITLNQTGPAPSPLSVGEEFALAPMNPVTDFYLAPSGYEDPVSGKNPCTQSGGSTADPQLVSCFIASNPDAENPQTIGATGLLGSTITSLLVGPPGTGFLGSLVPSSTVPLVNPLVSAVLSPVLAGLNTTLAPLGSMLDSQLLDPLLAGIGLGVGQTTVTFQAIQHSAPLAQSFVVPAKAGT